MRIQVDYDENMKNVSMTDLDTGFNAIYDATSDTGLIEAFSMFVKDSKEYPYTTTPVYNEDGSFAYNQLIMKEAISNEEYGE